MAAVRGKGQRGRRRERDWRGGWPAWGSGALEVGALLATALIAVVGVLGHLAGWLAAASPWMRLIALALLVLLLGLVAAGALRGWLWARRRLTDRARALPTVVALAAAVFAAWSATRPTFQGDVASLRLWIGGSAEAQRVTLAHQVYAAYRRADPAQLRVVLERARVYEPTVLEAASAFEVDAEVLMGVGSAESSFSPRDSHDGGRGLFQITAPPAEAVALARKRLEVERLDPLNQRHNAYVAAATLRFYLDEMKGDLFLALLAYNVGPRNGGLRSIMQQYGARDFVTVQPYLQTLPRDYPIRVLTGALAYRLWRTEGHLPRYEDGRNALHIQSVGIPGLGSGTS